MTTSAPRHPTLEALLNTPIGQVGQAEIRRLEQSSHELFADERAWFKLVAALVRWHHRHDVELVDASPGVEAAAGDVERGDGGVPPRR